MEDKQQFLLFPLSVIGKMIYDPEEIVVIVYYGLVGHAMHANKKASLKGAYEQFVYTILRRPEQIPPKLKDFANILTEESDVLEDSDCFFDENTFEVYDECISKIADLVPDKSTEEYLLLWYKVNQTLYQLGLEHGSESSIIYNAHDWEKRATREPLVAVSYKTLFDLYTRRKSTTEEERAEWAMYFGMLSKIGMKPFARTTRAEISMRMMGAKDAKALQDIIDNNGTAKKIYIKYSTRRKYEKLCYQIKKYHKVLSVPYGRCICISHEYKNEYELSRAINSRRKYKSESRPEYRPF